MSPAVASVALAGAVMIFAVLGPTLMRRSAPALMRAPRLAVTVVTGVALAWTAALLALGPLFALAAAGPSLLIGSAGEVCQRCLASASPFASTDTAIAVPALVPLALGALVLLAVGAGLVAEVRQRWRASRSTARWIEEHSMAEVLHGYAVHIVDDEVPYAWTLPARHGGIVVSSGAIAVLREAELSAVLAHEQAHLSQRHHLASTVVAGLQRTLGWVPAVRGAAQALPHYLEIAADAHAQRVAGTPALASALLSLGSPTAIAGGRTSDSRVPVLHAVGPQRIGRLVGAASTRGGTLSMSAVAGVSVANGLLGLGIAVPYIVAVITGCA